MAFLLGSLRDLDRQLQSKFQTRLLVLRGDAEDTLQNKMKEWGVKKLSFEADTEPYARQRDKSIISAAKCAGIKVCCPSGHTLYDMDILLAACEKGKPPNTMRGFQKLVAEVGLPSSSKGVPDSLPPLIPNLVYDETFHGVPTLGSLGYIEEATTPFQGGESTGLKVMEAYLENKRQVAMFEKPKTSPAGIHPNISTTGLSPYLSFGCVSPRLFFHKLRSILKEYPKHSMPPVSLVGQLYWREFNYLIACNTPNFATMKGNPLCRQIPWKTNASNLDAWASGKTGYPWIDALMTQLRVSGWVHHLGRHSVACFLTRGDLYISWEEGAKVFDRYLVDADWSINNFNWQWLSASAFFHQYFRVYSPVTFGKKYDKSGKFVRHWIPALKHMPDKYIYEPWLAPLSVQKNAGCIIGTDYPKPIVDHSDARKQNLEMMKAAYERNIYGNPDALGGKHVAPGGYSATNTGKRKLESLI